MSINRWVGVGRLVREPELRYTANGTAVTNFTLAVNRTFSNQNGEREADFINCQAWRKQAESIANYLRKGSLAGVEGRIQTRSYEDNDGKRIYVTEVVCDSVQFLESRSDRENNQSSGQGSNQSNFDNDPFGNSEPIDISDDDLPF